MEKTKLLERIRMFFQSSNGAIKVGAKVVVTGNADHLHCLGIGAHGVVDEIDESDLAARIVSGRLKQWVYLKDLRPV